MVGCDRSQTAEEWIVSVECEACKGRLILVLRVARGDLFTDSDSYRLWEGQLVKVSGDYSCDIFVTVAAAFFITWGTSMLFPDEYFHHFLLVLSLDSCVTLLSQHNFISIWWYFTLLKVKLKRLFSGFIFILHLTKYKTLTYRYMRADLQI